MKLHSDKYDWYFQAVVRDGYYFVIVEDTDTGRQKLFRLSTAHRYEGIANHMNSLTDDQMKDILRGGKK